MVNFSFFSNRKKRIRNLRKHVAHTKRAVVDLRDALLREREHSTLETLKEVARRADKLLLYLAGEEPGTADIKDIDYEK